MIEEVSKTAVAFTVGFMAGGLLGFMAMLLCTASGAASRAEEAARSDTVQVIRCRDCVHYKGSHYYCGKHEKKMLPGFYCASGERNAVS